MAEPLQPARFAVGAEVRVKAGTVDPDYPDIPLGGWVGVIRDVDPTEAQPLYEVEWTEETLLAAPEVYHHRCDRDDIDGESTWLDEVVLEPDSGAAPRVEQPAKLKPRPLNFADAEDRARAVFGLTSDEELPPVSRETLKTFHDYLSQKVRWGFLAFFMGADNQPHGPAVVRGMPAWNEQDLHTGLQVEIAAEGGEERARVPLCDITPMPLGNMSGVEELETYREWYVGQVGEEEPESPATVLQKLGTYALLITLAAALVGGVAATMDNALLAAQIGGGVLGVLGAVIGGMMENLGRRTRGEPTGFLFGGFLGLLIGGVVGGAAGPIVLTYLGAIPGAMAGTVGSWLLAALGVRGIHSVKATVCGAYIGAMVYVFLLDWQAALLGCTRGVLITGGTIIGLLVVGLVLTYLSARYGQKS